MERLREKIYVDTYAIVTQFDKDKPVFLVEDPANRDRYVLKLFLE